jgi:hypothetical protein
MIRNAQKGLFLVENHSLPALFLKKRGWRNRYEERIRDWRLIEVDSWREFNWRISPSM